MKKEVKVVDHVNATNYKKYIDKKIDVRGDVNLSKMSLTSIPIRFGKVYGNFNISNNNLSYLGRMPKIVKGNFNCSINNLKSLEGSPKKVYGTFDCSNNKLTSLDGCPKYIGDSFNFTRNFKLYSPSTVLKSIPDKIGSYVTVVGDIDTSNYKKYVGKKINVLGNVCLSRPAEKHLTESHEFNKLKELPIEFNIVTGDFDCSNNLLLSLKGSPKVVGRNFICSNNKLKSLNFGPSIVFGSYAFNNNLVSTSFVCRKEVLEGCPIIVGGYLYVAYNKLNSRYPKSSFFYKNGLTYLGYGVCSLYSQPFDTEKPEYIDDEGFPVYKTLHSTLYGDEEDDDDEDDDEEDSFDLDGN